MTLDVGTSTLGFGPSSIDFQLQRTDFNVPRLILFIVHVVKRNDSSHNTYVLQQRLRRK